MDGGMDVRFCFWAGANLTVNEEWGDVTSGVQWPSSPESSYMPRLPYDLELEKDAVYQASKTGMILELNHPGTHSHKYSLS